MKVIGDYARAGQPFLLSLHFNAPHWPWEAPGDEAEAERLRGKDPADFDGGSQKTYQRMITAMDAQVGRVLAALEQAGIAQDTIVIFTSDNGGERYADTWPFTGRKTELLEGGLRIPAIISWPARIPVGRVSEQVTANMDWLPTLLAAAGTSPDPAYPSDGMNLLPHLAEVRRSRSGDCSGATNRCGSAPRASVTGNISRSSTTRSCSTLLMIRSSAPT